MREIQTESNGQTLLSEAEVFQLFRMAVQGKPQTREELVAVIREAERLRAGACLLDFVLDGQLCMYQDNGKIMLKLLGRGAARTRRQSTTTKEQKNNANYPSPDNSMNEQVQTNERLAMPSLPSTVTAKARVLPGSGDGRGMSHPCVFDR